MFLVGYLGGAVAFFYECATNFFFINDKFHLFKSVLHYS